MRTKLKATARRDGSLEVGALDESHISRKVTRCRACHAETLEPVLSLGEQYLVNFVAEVDLSLPRAPLDLVRCSGCGLLQLGDTVNPDLLYRNFWYRSSVNQTMRDALDDLVQSVFDYQREGTWLDIGANDGYLLSRVPPKFQRIACEPALNFADDLDKIADIVIGDYFSAESECLRSGRKGLCDVVTSAAMFYDLDNPDAFVADVARVLAPGGVWVNQLNDSPTMLKRNAFDAICHEHLCYYDAHSLAALYQRHGLSIVGITHNEVNGGSMRVFARRDASGHLASLSGLRRVSSEDAQRFASRTKRWKQTMSDLLTGPLAMSGGLWLYGASTKGCCLLQYLDLPGTFKAIADRNPLKLGLKMAGTWLGIESEDDMRAEKPKYVFVLPWAFRDEFVKRERPIRDAGTTMVFPLPNIEFVL